MAKKPKKVIQQRTPAALGKQLTVPITSELSKGLKQMRSSKTPRVKGGM